MQIIDAQIHLWASGLPSNQSHWQVTHFTAEEGIVLMDEGGVDAAVVHPPEWDPGSTHLAFKAVRNYPGVARVQRSSYPFRRSLDGVTRATSIRRYRRYHRLIV
jgi:hypothetical protein